MTDPREGLRADGTLKESAIQSQIRKVLILEGFVAIHTSAFRQKRASGVSKGIPDLIVALPGEHVWVGLEVKAKDAKGNWHYTCWEQWDLHIKGLTFVVTNEEQALWAMEQVFPDRRRRTNLPRIEAEAVRKEPKK